MKAELEKYFDRLWPICRSLTGNGNRETLKILSEIADLATAEVPSGTQCFDWTIPPEWNVREAWIKDPNGGKVVDFADNNLHLAGYSIPFRGSLKLEELKHHIYSREDMPEVIPYVTKYYSPGWGFCMSANQLSGLSEGTYEVCIDTGLDPNGSMTVAEAVLPGESDREILISTYICHPSMANNELSGPLVSSFLYNLLKRDKLRFHTFRFLFIPETIGALWYLSVRGNELKQKLTAGYVLTCIGDRGAITYKKSRQGNSTADRAAASVLKHAGVNFQTEDFFPTGSDERQYCSPGFDLPVGSLMRTRYGKYKEYHTSADNRDFISFEAMEESVRICADIVRTADRNCSYLNLLPFGEPQLGKRGLYPAVGSSVDTAMKVNALMWMLNLSDGTNDLIGISERSGVSFTELYDAAGKLERSGILEKIKVTGA